jgi:hypothetical protein
MSARPEDGVVDKWGEAHDVPGLFVSDGSVFTTGAAANPTLTIVALAIRQAEELGRRAPAGALEVMVVDPRPAAIRPKGRRLARARGPGVRATGGTRNSLGWHGPALASERDGRDRADGVRGFRNVGVRWSRGT